MSRKAKKTKQTALDPGRYFVLDELTRLFAAAVSLLQLLIVATLAGTGLRAAELLRLRREDIFLDRRMLVVRRGKGNKQRLVPFESELAELLRPHLLKLHGSNPYVFQNSRGERLKYPALYKLVRRMGERADLSRTFPHRLRHTFLTQVFKQTKNIIYCQAVAGHSDVKVTSHYCNAMLQHDLGDIPVLKGLLPTASGGVLCIEKRSKKDNCTQPAVIKEVIE